MAKDERERVPSNDPVDEVIEANVIEPSNSEVVKAPWYRLPRPRAATVLTAGISAMWTFVALKTNFNGPPILDSLLLLAFGGYFTSSAVDKKRDKDKAKNNEST